MCPCVLHQYLRRGVTLSFPHFQEKALKFFSITGQTMESFVKSLDGDVKEPDSDENQFVFALAGIVTSKSSFGDAGTASRVSGVANTAQLCE